MSGIGFQTALSALAAAQQALQTIGHNISNAGTPGFSRQVVQLSARTPTPGLSGRLVGTGVQIGSVDRIVNSLLESRIQAQGSALGRQLVLRDHLVEMEALFGEPSDSGLAATLSGFFSELSSLTVNPDDLPTRTGVIQKGVGLADTFKILRGQMKDVLNNLGSQIDSVVSNINQTVDQLQVINTELGKANAQQGPPPDLLDMQGRVLKELGQLTDIHVERDNRGRVTVTAGGSLLLSPVGKVALEVVPANQPGGAPTVRARGAQSPAHPTGGRLAGLLQIANTSVDERIAALDRMAHNMILEMNRVHSTGIPLGGGFKRLVASNPLVDNNNSGSFLDDSLDHLNLPFEIQNGNLRVNVSNDGTGVLAQTDIPIDTGSMTVDNLVNALNAVPHLNANVDPLGVLRLSSDAGYRFDFSNRLPPTGDPGDSFGSAHPTLVGGAGPFNLAPGSSFTVTLDGGAPQTVTFNPSQFQNIAQATAAEVAAAINGQINGAAAEVVDGRLVLRSNATGATSKIQLADGTGSPLAALGLSTSPDFGGDLGVEVRFTGNYTGSNDRNLVFEAAGDGQVGSGNLSINVRDQNGALVTTLDVGAGYSPGKPLAVADGVQVSFGPGQISQAAGDTFDLKLVADGDSSDALVAFGLGGFFTGQNASDISVDPELVKDSRKLAGATSGAPGDNTNIQRMLAVQDKPAAGLDDLSVQGFYDRIITDLGVESSRAKATLDTQQLVFEGLSNQRDSISGVNLDEELLRMNQFQQNYQAAARFLRTLQQVNDVLMNLVR